MINGLCTEYFKMRINVNRESIGLGSEDFTLPGTSLSGPLFISNTPVMGLSAINKTYVDGKLINLNSSRVTGGLFNKSVLPGFTGDVTSVIGSDNLVLTNTGVIAGSYAKVVVNSKGRVTQGSALTATDIPSLSWTKIGTGLPTTLAGYGIADGLSKSGGTLTGNLKLVTTPLNASNASSKSYVDAVATTKTTNLNPGDIVRKVEETTPAGYLRANGGEVSQTTYSALYAVIGDSYTFSLQPGSGKPWRQQYSFNKTQSSDIAGWTTGTSLPGTLGYSQAIVTSSRVYLLGGIGSGDYTSTVYTAPINSDGTLGTWTTGTSLPGTLVHSQAIVTSSRVYLLGGYNNSSYVSTVYTAPINSDGTLGTWTTGTSLPDALSHSQAIVTSSRVYLLGGYNSSGRVSTVYTAPINSDGTLGTWTTGTSLPGILGNSQAIVTSSRVYLLGGYNSSGYTSTVYTAPINSDGTLGTWTTGTSLPDALAHSQAIVISSRVYLLGGFNGSSFVSTVYTAPINADGTLGTWTTGTSLPGALAMSQAIVTSSRVYLLGGHNGSSYVSTVYTAPFSGGLNDYSPYYNGTYAPTTPGNFKLPDYSGKEGSTGPYYFIKF